MSLTDTKVKNARPAEKAVKLTDGFGLYLLVHPNGSKYWQLGYRFEGKQKVFSIGVYPAVSLKWSTKTGHRVRVFSSIDFPIRLVVTHHYIRAVLVRCNIQRYSPLLRELHR
ncbi:hypothetical protein RX07_00443 [Escherichia coli]|nr:hypothetical protein RX07_00443 [Escherichia coli]